MNICEKMVYYYTKDIPSNNPGRTEIRRKTLDVLKTLLTEGFVDSNKSNSSNLRTLQKHFKVIKGARLDGKKSVYYLEDKIKKEFSASSKLVKKERYVNDYHACIGIRSLIWDHFIRVFSCKT